MAKKILVVDDEPDILKVMSYTLTENKYEVATAANGAEGLNMVDKSHPDLIVLDVLMPVMDGFGFFKAIKKDPAKSKIPILVLTARGGMRDTFEVLDADEFVSKPFDTKDLLEKIDILLKRKVLLLSQDSYLTERITSAFLKYNHDVDVVSNQEEMVKKGKAIKYKLIVAYLPLITQEPQGFISQMRSLRNARAKIIIYSDPAVKGTESNQPAVIGELKNKWEKAGAELFFDARINDKMFKEVLVDLIG